MTAMHHNFSRWQGNTPLAPRARAVRSAASRTAPAVALFARLEGILAATSTALGYRPDPRFIAVVDALDEAEQMLVGRDFLLWQMERFDDRFAASGLDQEFRGWFIDAYHSILDQIEGEGFVADAGRDLWQKNLALTRLQLIPACAQLVTMAAGVPRSVALKSGPAALWHVAVRCGGFRPWAEIHTHDPLVPAYFNPQGFEQCWRLLALLLRDNPACRGVTASAWFFDPALETVSPRLAYLRRVPQAAGARFLDMGADADSIRLATRFPPRRKAYDAGTYLPRRHAIVWARADILKAYG